MGAYDGQIALLTTKGLRLYKTQQRVESVQLDQVDPGQNQIEQLEQLSKSELPQDRLSAAVAQYNQGNNSEAEQLLSTIGALDQELIATFFIQFLVLGRNTLSVMSSVVDQSKNRAYDFLGNFGTKRKLRLY